MKTNNVMVRPMGVFQVEQRTKDGMFNATALLKQWNEVESEQKSIHDFVLQEDSFCESFMVQPYPKGVIENGELWLNEAQFRNFLYYLKPELSLVEYPCSLILNSVLKAPNEIHCKQTGSFVTYVIKDGSGLYKIGKSSNMRSRMKNFLTGNPTVEVVLIINADVEKELHSKFSKKHFRGEWFRLTKKDIATIIKTYCDNTPLT